MRCWAGMTTVMLLLAGSAAGAQELVVSAASSLTDAFRDIGRAFETTHAGVKIAFNFAASDVLLAQIAKGAPADVFASADEAMMNRAEDRNLLVPGTRRDFGRIPGESGRIPVAGPAQSQSAESDPKNANRHVRPLAYYRN